MFATVGDDFGLGGLEWQTAAPSEYPSGSSDNRVQEECVETLLALHFESLFGARPRLVLRSRAMRSEADISALDALGRVHLVEVKQNQTVTDKVVEQAAHYAFRYVFVNPVDLLRGQVPDAAYDYALYFAALYAGRQTKTLGIDDVKRFWNRREFWERIKADFGEKRTKAAYERLSPEQEAHVLGEVALELALERKREQAPRRRLALKDWPQLLEVGRAWASRGVFMDGAPADLATNPATAPWYRPRRPLVLWVVGRKVADSAGQELRRLRALGIDARALELEVRSRPNETVWHLRVRQEAAAARDTLERNLQQRALDEGLGPNKCPDVNLRFYREKSPSGRRTPEDGALLDRPAAD